MSETALFRSGFCRYLPNKDDMENTSFETLFTRKVHLIFEFPGDSWPIQNTLSGRPNGALFQQAVDEKLGLEGLPPTLARWIHSVRSSTKDVMALDYDRDVSSRFACFSHPRPITSPFIRWLKGSIAICLGLISLSLGQVSQAADDQKAREIVDGVARLFVSKSCTATVEMEITKEDLQRKITMQFWSVDESNILIRIRSPQEDAGTDILKVAGKIWYYLPKSNRTVKIPPSMMMSSWMGSDFTLNDLVKQSRLTDDYMVATSFDGQRDGVSISDYTLIPKPTPVVGGEITLGVRHVDRMPVRQRYYDEDGKLAKQGAFRMRQRSLIARAGPMRIALLMDMR